MPKRKVNKPKIAIVSLTSCEGCEFALIDTGHKFIDFLKKCDVREFRMISDKPAGEDEKFDICFIEGNPMTEKNLKVLEDMRQRSKLLVVLGNCAHTGGVWEMKNHGSKAAAYKKVYKKQKYENLDVREVSNFVKVDLTIPTCPIDAEEFLEFAYLLLEGRIPRIANSPVCYECQTKGYECLLQRGEICLGPITMGGCQAICLKSKQECWGCRGIFEGAQIDNFMRHLLKNFPRKKVYEVMEVFGGRDEILKEYSNTKKK